jgi:hypothetical protein
MAQLLLKNTVFWDVDAKLFRPHTAYVESYSNHESRIGAARLFRVAYVDALAKDNR